MPTIRGGLVGGRAVVDVHFHQSVIVAEARDDEVVEADGLIVSPGLIDIQINGGFGHDFTLDPGGIWAVGARLVEMGVTSFLPTVVTSPPENTDMALAVAAARPAGYAGADMAGLHFEGPWISPEMSGAHNPSHISEPDPGTARRWAGSGLVRMVTMAPEVPGADNVAAILAGAGVVVAMGHTAADHDTARHALAGDFSVVTHLFNQMTAFEPRRPGAVGAALLSDRVVAGLIVDGHHVDSATVDLAWRLLGPDRLVLVTDAMAGLGLGHGTYQLGDGPIVVSADGARTADGRLAGSVVTLTEAVLGLVDATGADLADALGCVTTTPARAAGLADRGTLRPGSRADITVMDRSLTPVMTYVGGRRTHPE